MFCANCGAELPNSAKFCGKCGFKTVLNDTAQPGPESGKTSMLFEEDDRTELLSENDSDATESVFDRDANSASSAILDRTELVNENDPNPAGTELLPDDKRADDSENSQVDFGIYKITGKIGQGGGGIVYKAIHTRLNKEVVIKQIINSNTVLNRQETEVLKGIKHTYLPQVFDFIEKDGQAFTVMDFVSGSDLDKLVRGGRKFSGKEIVRIGTQLCEAVSYLHTRKPPVIHSDIKPANVMLSDNGDICLIDFNVSLAFDKNASVIGGTRGFAPPEQLGVPLADVQKGITGELPVRKTTPFVNERSDVYSIGAFLRFLVTGQNPPTNYAPSPIPNNVKIPDGLLQIIQKATMLDPSKRYRSASEMLTAIKNIGKLDRRYKALKIQRVIVTVIAAVLMGGSILLTQEGVRKLREEHEQKYRDYISEIVSMISAGDYDKAEDVIDTASRFEPTRIEPYYNYEKILYLRQDYESCMKYPSSLIITELTGNELNDTGLLAEMYEMSADSAFELEDYRSAVELFQRALRYSELLVDCYRDMTISYARLGEIDNAEKSLADAKEHGIANDGLELMQGEIYAAKGDRDAAYNCFVNAMNMTSDDYLRFRAILVCDNMMLEDTENAAENAAKMIQLLNEQKDIVSIEYSGIVKEMLANEYAVAGDYTSAADCYQSLLVNGQLNYALQKNYFNILFSKLHDYDKCLFALQIMKQQNDIDYWVDMNFSYTYISIENSKTDQWQRDYSKAYDSYKSAMEQYEFYSRDGKTDANMDRLKGLISDLISYGWISE